MKESEIIRLDWHAAYFESIQAELIDYQDITVTMICTKHPRKLLKDLREAPIFRVTEKHPGIYVIEGERFRVRIIESKRLTEEENIWLKSLRKDADWKELEKIIELSEATRRRVNLGAYLHALLSANRKYVMEGMNMSKRESQEIRQMWEQIMDETGYRARVMAEGKASGISSVLTIIKGLQKNTPLSQLAEEAEMPLVEVERIQRELIPAI